MLKTALCVVFLLSIPGAGAWAQVARVEAIPSASFSAAAPAALSSLAAPALGGASPTLSAPASVLALSAPALAVGVPAFAAAAPAAAPSPVAVAASVPASEAPRGVVPPFVPAPEASAQSAADSRVRALFAATSDALTGPAREPGSVPGDSRAQIPAAAPATKRPGRPEPASAPVARVRTSLDVRETIIGGVLLVALVVGIVAAASVAADWMTDGLIKLEQSLHDAPSDPLDPGPPPNF